MLEKMIRMGELFDFYGQLLTERQQEIMRLYYAQDLSLGEIAETLNISRQAVHDNLRRSEKILEDYEEKLGLLVKTKLLKEKIQMVKDIVEKLDYDKSRQQMILQLLGQILDS